MTMDQEVARPSYSGSIPAIARPKARTARNGQDDDAAKEDKLRIVDELNHEYAVILLGSSAAVLREGKDAAGDPEMRLLTLDAFKEWMRPRKLFVHDKPLPYSTLWLNDKRRRQYAGLVFAPDSDAGDYYNLWRGFAVEPNRTGSCKRFLAHIAENVCNGDPELFTWVMGWFAWIFQHPTEKSGTALVLRGPQGAGKTIVGKIIGELLGQHYVLVGDPRYVTGRFNAHLIDRLLLQLDEATWGGDHEATGKLKDLVTGDYQLIEFKGKEPLRVRNYVRLLITSNSDWVIPAGLEERRFAVLDIGEHQLQNSAYFQAIEDEMAAGGAGALLHYLLTYDLTDVNVKQIPNTGALFEQKVASLTPVMSWWLDVLREGSLPGDKHGDSRTTTKALYESYIEHSHRRGLPRRGAETEIGMFLTRYVPGHTRERVVLTPGGPRVWCYMFPSLADCRASFDKAARHALEWQEGAENWTPDGGEKPSG